VDKIQEILGYIPKILIAFPTTMAILLCSLFFSLIIGLAFAVMQLARNRWLESTARVWIAFMRGVPPVVLISLFFLGLPQFVKSLGGDMSSIPNIVYIIACLSLISSANAAEMMRSSYLAVDKSQREAAYSVGMTGLTAFRRIVLPQAFGISIPMLGNLFVTVFKLSALAFTISVMDLFGWARAVSDITFGTNRLEVYTATAIIFWGLCLIMEYGSKHLERIYTKGRKHQTR
jgi:L-cystine transport system permease protein